LGLQEKAFFLLMQSTQKDHYIRKDPRFHEHLGVCANEDFRENYCFRIPDPRFLRKFAKMSASTIFSILPEILPPPGTTSVLFQPLLLGSPEG
jgi:hypothetical protein